MLVKLIMKISVQISIVIFTDRSKMSVSFQRHFTVRSEVTVELNLPNIRELELELTVLVNRLVYEDC